MYLHHRSMLLPNSLLSMQLKGLGIPDKPFFLRSTANHLRSYLHQAHVQPVNAIVKDSFFLLKLSDDLVGTKR